MKPRVLYILERYPEAVEAFNKTWAPLIYKGNGSSATRTYSLWLNSAGCLHLTSAGSSGF